ncbi:hypothetical protein [Klebsiella aerogenes]|uniref:hypothetical protein n=1 Tax=Klebsiella aerogenes TaxID=548 RepID=UPI000E2F4CEE|nr:hypothetical protein [Klebsiella aerogenes]
MTSKLTREERVQALYDLKVGQVLSLADIENVKMLSRMALAAMDSEPVAVVEPSDYVTAAQLVGEGAARKAVHELYEGALRIGDKLYRHAQQPVVPGDVLDALQKVARIRLDLNNFDGDRRGIADCLCDAEEALIEVVNRRAATLQSGTLTSEDTKQAEPVTTANKLGNSPVIPDGSEHCPCCGKKLRRACSVEGCEGKHVAHGLCKKHYDMKRWEDPEQVRKFREAGKRYRRKTKSAAAAPQEVSHD